MAEKIFLKGVMLGHTDMVTAIATVMPANSPEVIVTSSRDKSVLIWRLTGASLSPYHAGSAAVVPGSEEERSVAPVDYAVPRRRLKGHSHFVQDVVLSSDALYALSASWDGELRLWDLEKEKVHLRFIGHSKDVLSVAFSADNRQIVSASRDQTVKLWNVKANCMYSFGGGSDDHKGWVSCVRFSPNVLDPAIVSASWDGTVKVWNIQNCKLRYTFRGHAGFVNVVEVSPDSSVVASGGRDGRVLLWDLADGKVMWKFDAGGIVHALRFCPVKYWLCAATEQSVRIWDLEDKAVVVDIKPDTTFNHGMYFPSPQKNKSKMMYYCSSLAWSTDGSNLYAGYSDGSIRVWGLLP